MSSAVMTRPERKVKSIGTRFDQALAPKPKPRPAKTPLAAPNRSYEQRMLALKRANDVRSERAQLKRDLKAGRRSVVELLTRPPDYLETAKVFDVLLAVPKLGRVKVSQRLNTVKIAPSKTVGGLSPRQRAELVETLAPGWSQSFAVAARMERDRQLVAAVRRACVRSLNGWAYTTEIWATYGPLASSRTTLGRRLAHARAKGMVQSRRTAGRVEWRPAVSTTDRLRTNVEASA